MACVKSDLKKKKQQQQQQQQQKENKYPTSQGRH